MNGIEKIIDQQLEAYNARDLERFMSFYADDATLHAYPGTLVARGTSELRKRYQQRFEAPELHASILQRIVMPPFVVDREHVTGLSGGKTMDVIVIYEVRGDRIVDSRALTPDSPS